MPHIFRSIFLLVLFRLPSFAGLIQPSGLDYIGAFRLPNNENWDFGGEGLTYFPKGDSLGSKDGFPGSLYGLSLLQYAEPTGNEEDKFTGHSVGDRWKGGAWLTAGSNSAVIITGHKGMGADFYGEACGEKGYHAMGGYKAMMLFYSPEHLAEVALGKRSKHRVQPYAEYDFTSVQNKTALKSEFQISTQKLGVYTEVTIHLLHLSHKHFQDFHFSISDIKGKVLVELESSSDFRQKIIWNAPNSLTGTFFVNASKDKEVYSQRILLH